ncbi:LOW QUALITY PROTEIN: hypothetical protein TorRG33x02_055040 [Trema orientale]|uniref:Uncharacterized protein n=1 Tax=Trema orientale TaxID=63057 RepID=A0A2P5FLF8_TREOI|nr:LOW QUALITY PROTEIN: hypothetical protein TorRG33x02_055040 [Trema orientale]
MTSNLTIIFSKKYIFFFIQIRKKLNSLEFFFFFSKNKYISPKSMKQYKNLGLKLRTLKFRDQNKILFEPAEETLKFLDIRFSQMLVLLKLTFLLRFALLHFSCGYNNNSNNNN